MKLDKVHSANASEFYPGNPPWISQVDCFAMRSSERFCDIIFMEQMNLSITGRIFYLTWPLG